MVNVKTPVQNEKEVKDKAIAFEKLEDAYKFLDSLKKKEQKGITITHFG